MGATVITGANRGIGLELTRQLKARGGEIIAICRTPSPELNDIGVRIESSIDVSDASTVATLATRLAGVSIDLLINNAGIARADNVEAPNFDGIAEQFAVNAMAPLRVTTTLLPLLTKGAKVAIVTSRMGSITDNGSGGYYGYRMSKAAVNAAGMSLARDLAGRGIAVGLFHPGMVATDMTGKNGVPPADAARDLITRIDALALATSGKFVHAGTGEELPW